MAGTFPVNGAPDELVDDLDDGVDGADELAGRVALTLQSAAARGKGRGSVSNQDTHRRVMVSFLSEAKSTVQPNGVPSSSLRAYFLPIDAPESSTREAIPILRILRAARQFCRDTMASSPDGKQGGCKDHKKRCELRGEHTDVVNERPQCRVLRDGDNETLDWGDDRREREDL